MTEFIEGRPCKYGHTKRYLFSRACVECARRSTSRRRKATSEQRAQLQEWALQRVALGSTQELARRVGVPFSTVHYYITQAHKRPGRIKSVL
jgi:hypothetical protein